jgi:hypothetical protein
MLLDRDAGDLRLPEYLQLRVRSADQLVAEGLELNSREHFVEAALEYQSILSDPILPENHPFCFEVRSSLGAVLCLIAQTERPGPQSLDYLARAQALLGKALDHCHKSVTPMALARTRANLSIVMLSRYEQTSTSADLFTGLMTLEGVAEVFARGGDFEAEGWAHTIRDRLESLRARPR